MRTMFVISECMAAQNMVQLLNPWENGERSYWHSSHDLFIVSGQDDIMYNDFENYTFKVLPHRPRANGLKIYLYVEDATYCTSWFSCLYSHLSANIYHHDRYLNATGLFRATLKANPNGVWLVFPNFSKSQYLIFASHIVITDVQRDISFDDCKGNLVITCKSEKKMITFGSWHVTEYLVQ